MRRDKPDYMIMWGWGAMNPTAVKEAANIHFPMDKFIGVWWSGGDDDARAGGDDAKGYLTLNFNGVGTDYPAIQDIIKRGRKPGKSQVAMSPRLPRTSTIAASTIPSSWPRPSARRRRSPARRHQCGGRAGRLENLNITDERLKELGLDGFMAPLKVSCADHTGTIGVHPGVGRHAWKQGLGLVRAR